jgi:hypothetical protein
VDGRRGFRAWTVAAIISDNKSWAGEKTKFCARVKSGVLKNVTLDRRKERIA